MECGEIGEALGWLDSNNDGTRAIHLYSSRPNSHGALLSRTYQPITNRYQKFITHLQLQAIDQRTRLVLSRLLNHAIFDDFSSCIFMGKQANVYHATKHDGQEFAVKVFKDRDQNVQGGFGFRHGKLKHNSWKTIKVCAENEMRNLMRLKAAGIWCPTPILSRLHVLVMEFLGKSGSPAPCLKDVDLSVDKMCEFYIQMIVVIRNLYQKCKLVHGDLSEYNILYYEGNLHIIDVSQSVDLDHPLAFKLLYGDCIRVSNYFKNNGVEVLSQRDLLDIILDSSITDESLGCYLEESIFPKSGEDLMITLFPYGFIGHNLLPKQPKVSDTTDFSTILTTNLGTDENEVDDDDSSDLKGAEPHDTMMEGTQETKLGDKKAARKLNKKKVKEEKREARKTKTTKYVKKKKNKNKLSKKKQSQVNC